MSLETQIESPESQTVANIDHATPNGAEEDGEAGANQAGESTDTYESLRFFSSWQTRLEVNRC